MKCLTWLRSNTFGARYSACCKWRADQQSAQQNWENGEAGAGDSQPAWQHRLHSAEASSMAADAFGRHCHPRVCPHRPGLHWHRRRPFCHVTEHHSDGGEARGHEHTNQPGVTLRVGVRCQQQKTGRETWLFWMETLLKQCVFQCWDEAK